METFSISQGLLERIIEHARSEAPHEVCGMIGGTGTQATHIYETSNPDASALTYSIDPREAFNVIRQTRADRVDFIGVYHSHPATEAYPSPTDISKAAGPELVYLIVSLRCADQPEARAFRMDAGQVEELTVTRL